MSCGIFNKLISLEGSLQQSVALCLFDDLILCLERKREATHLATVLK